jgi:hypothetical protein
MRGCAKVEAAVDVLPVEIVGSARPRAMHSPVALRQPGRNEARSDCCQAKQPRATQLPAGHTCALLGLLYLLARMLVCVSGRGRIAQCYAIGV